MKTIKELYPEASDDALQEAIDMAEKYGLDASTIQITIYESEALGRWAAKISRYGYRKIAAAQPGYEGHHYMSLYKGDKVSIVGNNVEIVMVNESRTYNDLTGAIAWLHDNGKLQIVRLCYTDYAHMKYAWDSKTGRPDYMMQKEAEVAVIRKAYSYLFDDSTPMEQENEIEYDTENIRGDLLSYIKANKSHMESYPVKPLGQCTLKELQAIVAQIKTSKGSDND